MATHDLSFGKLSSNIVTQRYLDHGKRTWKQLVEDVINSVVNFNQTTRSLWSDEEINLLRQALLYRWFLPGGRYMYYSNKEKRFYNNCYLFNNDGDTREGWAKTVHKSIMALMTGGGIGIDYANIREAGAPLQSVGGVASGPISLMEMVNDCGRQAQNGGTRRAAIYASLPWDHPDIFKFIEAKNWPDEVVKGKARDYFFPGKLDTTNISTRLNKGFWDALNAKDRHAESVLDATLWNALMTSEPGFQNDWDNQILRNACTEVISGDSGDVCNLGSMNIARLDTKDEFRRLVNVSTKFLFCGTIAAELPLPEMYDIRNKNRRLGLGIMGFHEWLIKRKSGYEVTPELHKWLEIYKNVSDETAKECAKKTGLSEPIAKRAIAPNGTIGIVAETTTGIEPIFATAYKRKYLTAGAERKFQYVIDATVQRLLDEKIITDPNTIEDAMTLSNTPEKRIRFQWEVQKYVDQAISSTINIPNFKELSTSEQLTKKEEYKGLIKRYLPELRGLTFYSDGSRGGQPLEKVDYYEAKDMVGMVFDETSGMSCKAGVCGV